jgi:hypothetical protein
VRKAKFGKRETGEMWRGRKIAVLRPKRALFWEKRPEKAQKRAGNAGFI